MYHPATRPATCAVFALALILSAAAAPLAAQAGSAIRGHAPSDRELANAAYLPSHAYVRVTLTTGDRTFGHFVSADPTGVVLRDGAGQLVSVPAYQLRRIDVLTGHQRGSAAAFGTTMILTGAIGGAVMAATHTPCEGSGWDCYLEPSSRSEAFAMGALFTGVLLGIPFGILAAANEREVWERTRLPQSAARGAALRLAPTPGGGVRASISIPVGVRR